MCSQVNLLLRVDTRETGKLLVGHDGLINYVCLGVKSSCDGVEFLIFVVRRFLIY